MVKPGVQKLPWVDDASDLLLLPRLGDQTTWWAEPRLLLLQLCGLAVFRGLLSPAQIGRQRHVHGAPRWQITHLA